MNNYEKNHLLGIKGGPIMTEVTATNFANERNFRTGMALGGYSYG